MTESVQAGGAQGRDGVDGAGARPKTEHHVAREVAIGAGLGALLVFLILWSMTIGAYYLTIPDAVQAVGGALGLTQPPENTKTTTILLVIRLPCILLTALVGAVLAISGAAYQGLFKNPMVAPDILGVSSGAGTGAALAILLGLGSAGVQLTAFAFGLGAVLLVAGGVMVVDDLARTLVSAELPVGVLTSLIGAPLFIFMLVRGRKEWL